MKKSTVMPSFGFSTGLRYCLLRSATALAQSASFNSTLGTGSYRNEALPSASTCQFLLATAADMMCTFLKAF